MSQPPIWRPKTELRLLMSEPCLLGQPAAAGAVHVAGQDEVEAAAEDGDQADVRGAHLLKQAAEGAVVLPGADHDEAADIASLAPTSRKRKQLRSVLEEMMSSSEKM
eukprot:SRR837773.19373.p5 GENE.SRR837773.19373~~SRR837773.19373.p5  ORF type:complete len:107 (+),score=42.67 SRR837773.19373:200-520(+)